MHSWPKRWFEPSDEPMGFCPQVSLCNFSVIHPTLTCRNADVTLILSSIFKHKVKFLITAAKKAQRLQLSLRKIEYGIKTHHFSKTNVNVFIMQTGMQHDFLSANPHKYLNKYGKQIQLMYIACVLNFFSYFPADTKMHPVLKNLGITDKVVSFVVDSVNGNQVMKPCARK